VTVSYSTADGSALAGSDYMSTSGAVTFAPGVVSRSVSVPVIPDGAVETDEFFFLNLGAATNASVADGQGVGIISDDDAPSLSVDELVHGSTERRAPSTGTGPTDRDYFRLAQKPGASYEVSVDGFSGGLAPVVVERLAADNLTVLQAASSGTTGIASLRWSNGSAPVTNQHISVRSLGCLGTCTPSDTYRLRAYETTDYIPRFNNSSSQVTILVLQSSSPDSISGTVLLRSAAGATLAVRPFTLTPHGTFVLNTASVVPGVSGSVAVANNGRFGELSGKAVSVEPATGFTFDTEMSARPR
jgi:Calx-beta domain